MTTLNNRPTGPSYQQVFRRLEDEGVAGARALHRADAADAGRADQPSRPERRHLARQLPAELEKDPPHRLPRPVFPGQRLLRHYPPRPGESFNSPLKLLRYCFRGLKRGMLCSNVLIVLGQH